MPKILKILYLIIVLTQRIQCEITKCCPENEIFLKSSQSCRSAINRTAWDANNIEPSKLPNCQREIRDVFVGGETYTELNGCIDKDSDGKFVAVSCAGNPGTIVHLMNKCCPIGQSYDHIERNCKDDPRSQANFKHLFANSTVVFIHNVPECSADEVYVEYFSTAQTIRFFGNTVNVNNNPLSLNKFCIEDLTNVDPTEARGNEEHIVVRSCQPQTVCNKIPCIRRCCKADQMLVVSKPPRCEQHPNGTNLKPMFYEVNSPLTENVTPAVRQMQEYGIKHSWKCDKKYPLLNDPGDIHYLNENGYLHIINKKPRDNDNYCIEIVSLRGKIESMTLLCSGYKEPGDDIVQLKFVYYPYFMIISCIFLFLTLIVHLLLPKMLTIDGKTLMCYVVSSISTYILLAIMQLSEHQIKNCRIAAYCLLYFTIAMFCWLTAKCLESLQRFGSLRMAVATRNKRSSRRFYYYSAYAWLFPLIWCLLTWYAEETKPLPDEWNPIMKSENRCFLDDETNIKGYSLFLTLPIGIHLVVNCALFIKISIYCNQVKADIHRMQSSSDGSSTSSKQFKFSKEIYIMNLKLFTVMGVTWIMEIVTTFYKNKIVEFTFDAVNLCQGPFIFIIIVLRKTVLRDLKHRFGFKSKLDQASTSKSSTISSIDIPMAKISPANIKAKELAD